MSDQLNKMPTAEDIERKLKEIFGDASGFLATSEAEDAEADVVPASLGVLVHRAGGKAVITQADLEAINGSKLRIETDPVAETITLTMITPE